MSNVQRGRTVQSPERRKADAGDERVWQEWTPDPKIQDPE
ncbi:hypothetical protein BMS3Abin14_01817 [bacterium BMS3Abin14]|nr:hypothetical protein BMS3Abin14_01817 [bacterium BMS3Abin14]